MKYFLFIFLFFFASCKEENRQTNNEPLPPFWNDIRQFKKQDSISFPPKNAILFIGSSSFTMWKDVQNYFPGHTIVNRGFGGSTLLDQIRYANDIIFPYEPKQIVIYCGENDLASSDSVTAQMVFDRFNELDAIIRDKTDADVLYVSMKPSPSRRPLLQKMQEANAEIRDFIETLSGNHDYKPNYRFIDVHSKMLNEFGQPMPELFLADSLHMNEKGYAIWKKEIEPYLIK
ncbi:MAG TPA: GDSL-type esterase/lipase family protein [Chitinophagaceae bacterium]|nr:GDSL-type esterase/lipase family protein [Chitinophagaceae bacterium]